MPAEPHFTESIARVEIGLAPARNPTDHDSPTKVDTEPTGAHSQSEKAGHRFSLRGGAVAG